MFWLWLAVIIVVAFFSLVFACSFVGAIETVEHLNQELYGSNRPFSQEYKKILARKQKEGRVAASFALMSVLLQICVIIFSAIFLH